MRAFIITALLSLFHLSSCLVQDTQHKLNTVEDVLAETKPNAGAAAGATNSEAVTDKSTTFNGVQVPPMKELNGDAFDQEIKDGYWYEMFRPRKRDGVSWGCWLTRPQVC